MPDHLEQSLADVTMINLLIFFYGPWFGYGPCNVLDLEILGQCQPFSARSLCLQTKSL